MANKVSRAKRKTSSAKRGQPAKGKQTSSTVKKAAVSNKVSESTLRPPLPASWTILQRACTLIWQHRLLFAQLALVYLLVDLVVIRSVTAFDVGGLRQSVGAGALLSSFSIFSALLANAASGSGQQATSSVYHFFLVILLSLMLIWALRQLYERDTAKPAPKFKAVVYQSTTPLVPFLLLLLLLGVQLIPLLIGATIYTIVVGGGIAVTILEQVIFLAVLLLTAWVSLYWVIRTVVALYIVTLPGMQPMQAYRSARDLVQKRRLSVFRKIVFLPVVIFVVGGIIVMPIILLFAPLAQWLFFVLTAIGLIVIHAYLFTLYRELLPHEQN